MEGGWYAIFQLPQTLSDDEWAYDILAQGNILVHPGYFFNIERKSCIVASLLPVSDRFENALLHIKQLINEL